MLNYSNKKNTKQNDTMIMILDFYERKNDNQATSNFGL